jgi:hypothetical protein
MESGLLSIDRGAPAVGLTPADPQGATFEPKEIRLALGSEPRISAITTEPLLTLQARSPSLALATPEQIWWPGLTQTAQTREPRG